MNTATTLKHPKDDDLRGLHTNNGILSIDPLLTEDIEKLCAEIHLVGAPGTALISKADIALAIHLFELDCAAYSKADIMGLETSKDLAADSIKDRRHSCIPPKIRLRIAKSYDIPSGLIR